MGRRQKLTLVYGIKISDETAQTIYENEYDKEKQTFKTEYEAYHSYIGKYYPDMWANDIEASIHNRFFEIGFQHYFGIRVEDDVEFIPTKVPKKALESYEQCIKPIMKKYGMKNKPKMYVISQIV